MNDYTKFAWYHYTYEELTQFRNDIKNMFDCVLDDYPRQPMPFEIWKEIMEKRQRCSVDKPENVFPLDTESTIYKYFKEWLEDETEI